MTRLLLIWVLSVIRAQHVSSVPSCPASCLVCSEDTVICNRLAHIIDAPDTTQALLLTEGSISTVQPASLSDLSNITVIVLSHNHISVLGEQSFRNLPVLHTLLLDHNLLTGQALQGGALTNLTRLEVLALGHNLISMIRGGWFEGSKALRSLKLDGNLLTSLDSGSFPVDDLKHLESLDLSDNLIHHLDRSSFVGLESLQTLDLSRNRLSSAPAEAFSYLSWLTNLNLDLNSWNCSCELLDLATFLSTFMQQPGQTLYNGRRMVCVSTDNPAVTTVLELTEANCVPSNQNITVKIEPRSSVTPQLYARDLAVTAVICFIAGVGLTLLVVLIYYQVSKKKKLKESKKQKVEEEGSSTTSNHQVNHLDVSEKRRERSLQANSSQPWDREITTLDPRRDGHGRQIRSQLDENGSHFVCSECSAERQRGMGPNPMRYNNRINGGMEAEEETEKRRVRMVAEEERRKLGNQQGILTRDIPNKFLPHGNTNSFSHPRKEAFSERPETLASYRVMGESYRTDMEGKNRGQETLHCQNCHSTYRPPEQNIRQGRNHTNMRDSPLFEGLPTQYRQIDRGGDVNHVNQFDMMQNTELRRETRNVTFDLERSRTLQGNSHGNDKREDDEGTPRDKERPRKHKAKVQSSRLLKVKLNLNPLRKSKVHPKGKAKHSEKSSSKKSKDKRRDRKDRGEKEGKGKSGKKGSKTKGSTEDGEEEGEKNKGTSKKGSTEGDQGENKLPENSQPGTTTHTANPLASAFAIGQGHNMLGGHFQYPGAGLAMGSAQLSSQHPLSLSATGRNQTSNLSLLGSAGSQLTGSSSLSLPGGNFMLNTMAPGSNAQFPSYPANSVAPNIAIGGPSMAPSGVPDSFRKQAGVGLVSPASSLLANAVHANPLPSMAPSSVPDSFRKQAGVGLMSPASSLLANAVHANPLQASPMHTSQPAGLAPSLTANPAVNPAPGQSLSQTQLPPDSSIAKLKSDPAQGPGLQTSKGVQQLPPESQTPQTKESHTLPTQAPSSADGSGMTPQAPSIVEKLSNTTSQTEAGRVPAGPTVNTSTGVLTEGLAAGVSGDSMQAADGSVLGVSAPNMSTQSVSSIDDAGSTAALLQQEYLSEEGGSSPRRKLRLVLPEKTSNRLPTALERKIR